MPSRLALLASLALLLPACPPPAPVGTQVTLSSPSAPTVAFLSFGADSAIVAADFSSFCTASAPLACSFPLTGSQLLPNAAGAYLNVTIAMGSAVGCGSTKAELNVNNPAWYDTLDVSLVDGYSNQLEINYAPPTGASVKLGPPAGKTGNEQLLGVYPYGCDLCTANSVGTCGIPQGAAGCKSGTQYAPVPPCQYQGAVMGGGGSVVVSLVAG